MYIKPAKATLTYIHSCGAMVKENNIYPLSEKIKYINLNISAISRKNKVENK